MQQASTPKTAKMSQDQDKKVRLQDLPVEIHLGILSQLPVRNVLQMRQVNRYFGQVVDQNMSVFESIQRRNLARIEDTVNTVLAYDVNIQLIDALLNFVHNRGIELKLLSFDCMAEIKAFVSHWLYRVRGIQDPEDLSQHGQSYGAFATVEAMVLTYLSYQDCRGLEEINDWQLSRSIKHAGWLLESDAHYYGPKALELLELSQDDLRNIYNKLKVAPKEVMPAYVAAARRRERDCHEHWPLTLLLPDGFDKDGDWKEEWRHRRWTLPIDVLVKMLGVPTLPTFVVGSPRNGSEFVYYVETEAAHRMMKSAVGASRPLSPAEKALVLQHLFLF